MVALDDSLMSVLSGMRLAAFSRMEPNEVIDEVLASDIVDDPTRSPALEPAKAAATARRRRAWGKHASLAAVTLGAVGGFVAITRTIDGSGGNAFDHTVVRSIG